MCGGGSDRGNNDIIFSSRRLQTYGGVGVGGGGGGVCLSVSGPLSYEHF